MSRIPTELSSLVSLLLNIDVSEWLQSESDIASWSRLIISKFNTSILVILIDVIGH